MNIDYTNCLFFTAFVVLVRLLNDITQNDTVRPQRQCQVPKFVNWGRATPLTVMSTSRYLFDEDFISFIKRYGSCNSKEALSNCENRYASLNTVFGSVDEGWKVIEDITNDVYDQL